MHHVCQAFATTTLALALADWLLYGAPTLAGAGTTTATGDGLAAVATLALALTLKRMT